MTISSIPIDIDFYALKKQRIIHIQQGKGIYSIPSDKIYEPLLDFIKNNKNYHFRLLTVLHAAGVKMLTQTRNISIKTSLFATGGLYLTLDLGHTDLAINGMFGDFTAGLSHYLGVALAVMVASEAYQIAWDEINAIPVSHKKTLDYTAQFPNQTGLLQFEAKGGTSRSSLYNLKRNAFKR